MRKIINFLKANYGLIFLTLFIVYMVHYVFQKLSPKFKEIQYQNEKINSLNKRIGEIEFLNKKIEEIDLKQKQLDSSILDYNKKINELDSGIISIKDKKILINKTYDEKIKNINHINVHGINSFFTGRY